MLYIRVSEIDKLFNTFKTNRTYVTYIKILYTLTFEIVFSMKFKIEKT